MLFILFGIATVVSSTSFDTVARVVCKDMAHASDHAVMEHMLKVDSMINARIAIQNVPYLELLALVNNMLDGMSSNLQRKYLSTFSEWESNMALWILDEFSGASKWLPTLELTKSGICKKQLRYAPLWNLSVTSPLLMANPEIAKIVYRQRALRKIIESTATTPTQTIASRDILGKLPKMSSSQFLKFRIQDEKSYVEWAREAVALILAPPSVFHAQERRGFIIVDAKDDRVTTAGKDRMSYELGRILGLMFVRGIQLDRIVFEWDFYQILFGHNDSHRRATVTFGKMAKGFWDVVPRVKMDSKLMIRMLSKLPESYETQYY